MHEAALVDENAPAAHAVHVLWAFAPDSELYVPASHPTQAVDFAVVVYVPAGHGRHVVAPDNTV